MEKYPIEPKVVRVLATDYNPGLVGTGQNPWDGYPFSDQPTWLRRLAEVGLLVPTTRNGTDYAEWLVGPDKVLATAGDWLSLEKDGTVKVIKEGTPNPHIHSKEQVGLGSGTYFEA